MENVNFFFLRIYLNFVSIKHVIIIITCIYCSLLVHLRVTNRPALGLGWNGVCHANSAVVEK
jgi:hypothetical protein